MQKKYAKIWKNMQKYAKSEEEKIYKNIQKFAILCKNMQKYAN